MQTVGNLVLDEMEIASKSGIWYSWINNFAILSWITACKHSRKVCFSAKSAQAMLLWYIYIYMYVYIYVCIYINNFANYVLQFYCFLTAPAYLHSMVEHVATIHSPTAKWRNIFNSCIFCNLKQPKASTLSQLGSLCWAPTHRLPRANSTSALFWVEQSPSCC